MYAVLDLSPNQSFIGLTINVKSGIYNSKLCSLIMYIDFLKELKDVLAESWKEQQVSVTTVMLFSSPASQ